MSLLNDMLRDLSRHRPAVNGADGQDSQLLASSSFASGKRQSWLPLVVFFVVIFCAVLAAKHFLTSTFGSSIPRPQPVVAQPVITNNASISPVSASLVHPDQAQDVQVLEDTAFIAPETQQHIDDLFMQAERAIGMDRLTSPVEDNAYGYYQKILTLNPDNESAKEGLDGIASRYLLKAREQLALGNKQQVDALIQRARFVSERYVQAHEISAEEMATSYGNTNAASASDIPVTDKNPVETIKPFTVAEAASISITSNAGWQDEQIAQHAQQLIQQGKQAEAMDLLKNFVAKEKSPALSAALLTDLYIQQGNTHAAGIVLQKADYLPVDVNAKLRAQILNASGDDGQAIAILEKHLDAASANEAYRALLASLYHKTANYQQSITSYQRLISGFGEKPAYWLGLALAYDGLSQPKSALQAYRRLREFPQLQEQVKKYTDQRIAALSGE